MDLIKNSVYDFCMYNKVQASRGIEKRWDEEFALSIYNNMVNAKRK